QLRGGAAALRAVGARRSVDRRGDHVGARLDCLPAARAGADRAAPREPATSQFEGRGSEFVSSQLAARSSQLAVRGQFWTSSAAGPGNLRRAAYCGTRAGTGEREKGGILVLKDLRKPFFSLSPLLLLCFSQRCREGRVHAPRMGLRRNR